MIFRHPNHKDPECTPSKLFRVEQIKSSRHHPWWEKKVLSELKLEGLVSYMKIIKIIIMHLYLKAVYIRIVTFKNV